MASMVKIMGMSQVLKNLATVDTRLQDAAARGLKLAGLFLQRESQEIVPVQFGTLKASAFTRASGSGYKTDVIVGYTAAYAVYVHENLEALHGAAYNAAHSKRIAEAVRTKTSTVRSGSFARGANQQAKFLERPAREKRQDMLKMVFDEMSNAMKK